MPARRRWSRTPALTVPSPGHPRGEPTLTERFRRESSRLARFYALCASTGAVNAYRNDIAYFEEVRVWVAKFDAEDRKSRGEVPADIAMYLRQLAAGAVEAGGITDIYAAAGIERPDLSHLNEAYIERMQQAAIRIWPSRPCGS